jgi:predicted metal-binding protein
LEFKYRTKRLENFCPIDIFTAKYVDIPQFTGYCKACPQYGKRWSCPPHAFDVMKFWKSFNTVHIIGTKIILAKAMRGLAYSTPGAADFITAAFDAEKKKLLKLIWRLEKKNPGSIGLSAGLCDLCEKCARDEGKPCRQPGRMRYLVESVGGNVADVSKDLLGTEIQWMVNDKIPDYYMLICALLMK